MYTFKLLFSLSNFVNVIYKTVRDKHFLLYFAVKQAIQSFPINSRIFATELN